MEAKLFRAVVTNHPRHRQHTSRLWCCLFFSSEPKMAATAEEEWACERCTYLNANSSNQCVMCEWEEPTTQGVAAGDRMPTTMRPLVIGAAAPPAPSTATTTDTRSAVIRQLPVRLPPSDYRGGVVTGGEPQAQGGNDSTWEVSLMGLVGRIATPAKFIFNGACVRLLFFFFFLSLAPFEGEREDSPVFVVFLYFFPFYIYACAQPSRSH